MRRLMSLLAAVIGLAATAAELPDTAVVLPGYTSREAAFQQLSAKAPDALEGLWDYPEEGMVVAIDRDTDASYRIIVVETDNEAVDPGTVIGRLAPTANKKKMHLWLYSVLDSANDLLMSPEKCVGEIKDGSILIKKRKLKMHVAVNLTRFLPSVFGGIRVYPHIESTAIEPGLHKIDGSLNQSPLIF